MELLMRKRLYPLAKYYNSKQRIWRGKAKEWAGSIWHIFSQPLTGTKFWTPLGRVAILVTVGGVISTTILGVLSFLPIKDNGHQKKLNEGSLAVTENRIWEKNLVDQTRIEYVTYDSGLSEGKTEQHFQPKVVVQKAENRLIYNIKKNTTFELTRPFLIPSFHLGHIFLYLEMSADSGLPNEPVIAYLLIDAQDPVILDTFTMKSPVAGRYDITSLSGSKVKFFIRVQSENERALNLSLSRLSLRSEPLGGTIIIQAIQQWDGKNLDGFLDDYSFRVEKVIRGEYLFWQKVKMAKDGYTIIKNLQPGTYFIMGVFNSIVMDKLGEISVSNESGVFKQFRCPQSRYLQLKVLYRDGTTPVMGADILVESNRPEGGPIRGCDRPECRISTNAYGVAELWLPPALDPERDYYVIRIFYNHNEIGRKNYHIGRSDEHYERNLNIVTELDMTTVQVLPH